MDLCSISSCGITPQPIAGAVGGPILLMAIIASVTAPPPKRLYDGLLQLSGMTALGLVLISVWLLFKGPHGPLLITSGLGCAALSLTAWLSRGEIDGWDGWDDLPEEPEPEPDLSIDWEDFERKVREEAKKQPALR